MFYTISRFARKYIRNVKNMCDECLGWQEHQTPEGNKLCDKCNQNYIFQKRINKAFNDVLNFKVTKE